MSIEIHMKTSVKAVIEYLKGIVEAMSKNDQNQHVNISIDFRFLEDCKKKDC